MPNVSLFFFSFLLLIFFSEERNLKNNEFAVRSKKNLCFSTLSSFSKNKNSTEYFHKSNPRIMEKKKEIKEILNKKERKIV